MSCPSHVFPLQLARLSLLTLSLPKPVFVTTHVKHLCTLGAISSSSSINQGAMSSSINQSTSPTSINQGAIPPIMGGCNCTPTYNPEAAGLYSVTYNITGSGPIPNYIKYMVDGIEQAPVSNNGLYTLYVRNGHSIRSIIVPTCGASQTTLGIDLTPLSNVVVYVHLGNVHNPTSTVKVVGNAINIRVYCVPTT
ncbi:MAG: hypothetical protein QXH41_06695 [Metallosphaera sp.]